MEHPHAGGRLRVEILGSVLMATIMIEAEKIRLSLGYALQSNYPAFVGARAWIGECHPFVFAMRCIIRRGTNLRVE